MTVSWWPFSKRKVAPFSTTHTKLAAQYFWMSTMHRIRVLHYLGVPEKEISIVHASMQPYNDVKQEMELQEQPEISLTSEVFMDKLKALELMGQEYIVLGVLQNFFASLDEAKAYLPAVAKWPAVLK